MKLIKIRRKMSKFETSLRNVSLLKIYFSCKTGCDPHLRDTIIEIFFYTYEYQGKENIRSD